MQTANAQRERKALAEQNRRWSWHQHPGWSEYADRHRTEPVRMPPPSRSRAEIRALIVGRSG